MNYTVPTMDLRSFAPSEQLVNSTRGVNRGAGNYGGDITLQSNNGARVPENQNTSLWITNLPPNLTYQELLDHIAAYRVGRVRSTFINGPTATKPTAAAAVSFFSRQHAEILYNIIRNRGIQIQGYWPEVQYNRHRVMEDDNRNASRVLLIAGDPYCVNPGNLRDLFKLYFVFQEDAVIDHGTVTGADGSPIARLEFRFGSYRSQANFGLMLIRNGLKVIAHAEYGADPCGP